MLFFYVIIFLLRFFCSIFFFFSSRRRHTRCALVTGVQTCALPISPGASGNIVTEDLVFMLEAMGLRTGIDIEALSAVREILKDNLPGEPLYGFLPDAGLPLGFETASQPSEVEAARSEEHTSELQSLMRISYAVFCLKKKKTQRHEDN